ncbi:CASC3/Barentsz eIF4AIII binding-domain-containing protein [Xylaria grammica]|nr:CASC3/Barentsz eIF4AIII binding-domain-containing protein [Xylaria grammica]
MAAGIRRRKLIGHKRRVEDEGEDEGGPDQLDLDDDSLSDGSLASDDVDAADDSDTSNVEDTSPTRPPVKKKIAGRTASTNGNRKAHPKPTPGSAVQKHLKSGNDAVSDNEFTLNGSSVSDKNVPVEEVEFEDAPKSPAKVSAPIVVSSNSVLAPARDGSQGPPGDRRRTEHEEYRRKRDEDPSFVPNRGAFFMHDHRHAGPSANGFRPFGRASRGGRGRGIGGPYAPTNYPMHSPADPTISAPWAHDMHETVTQPPPVRQPRPSFTDDGPPNGNGFIPTCPQSSTPINRKMSTEKLLGTVPIRVFLPGFKESIVFPNIHIKQYTKLPDHRPPLRRDKPVRISLPELPHRYVFPAIDRSFIFIPRAMRPNQRLRGKPRSGLGSIGGFSRRTSVFGGSAYAGSAYSPSIALSRRSSIAPDMNRDYLASPTGSVVSRPALPYDTARPVVRLPPQTRQDQRISSASEAPAVMPLNSSHPALNERPQPQTHPLPPKPPFVENRAAPIPMHQPRPQKTVSVASIESPENSYHQAFHQQVPVQVSNGLGQDSHARHPSYPSQHSTGTPLSQIPERAIHAPPFQPNQFSQQGFYPTYQMIPPQQGYYYPAAPYPGTIPPGPTAFVPGSQPGQQPQSEIGSGQPTGQNSQNPNLVAQEVNGMVYYYDASQLAPIAPYTYPTSQGYPMPNVGINGMVTPSPDGYYYPTPGVYYPQ